MSNVCFQTVNYPRQIFLEMNRRKNRHLVFFHMWNWQNTSRRVCFWFADEVRYLFKVHRSEFPVFALVNCSV